MLGVFEDWDCALGRFPLHAGDLLAIYSDGITEATRQQEQFGEERLIEALRLDPASPVEDAVTGVFARVQEFSSGEQMDDLPLVVARVR